MCDGISLPPRSMDASVSDRTQIPLAPRITQRLHSHSCSHSLATPQRMRPHRRMLRLLLACAAALPLLTVNATEDLSSSPAERARSRGELLHQTVTRGGGGRADWSADASSLLRMGMQWQAEEEEEEEAALHAAHAARRGMRPRVDSGGGGGGMVQMGLDHLTELGSALWLPLDWLLHVSLGESVPSDINGHDGTTHPLHSTYEAALQVLGMRPVQQPNNTPQVEPAAAATIEQDETIVTPATVPTPASASARSLLSFPSSASKSSTSCPSVGRSSNATRTLQTCLTASNDASQSQSASSYATYLSGSLLAVFASEPWVVLNGSITPTTSCEDVQAWVGSSDWLQTDVATLPGYDTATPDAQQHMIFQACGGITVNATTSDRGNITAVQYCQLFERCYARANFCHTWVDTLPFCVCPYDRTGDYCEHHVPFQCDVQMAYPGMDVQTYTLGDGRTTAEYSCPLPTSFHSRLPSTVGNPGSNSKVPLLPSRTNLQIKYGYNPALDGTPPCIEYPASSSTSNPGISASSPQQFRFGLLCKFMSDADPFGTLTASPPVQNPTYNHVRQAPSDNVVARLTAGNYTWNTDYVNGVQPAWNYDVLRHTTDGQGVEFAVSVVDSTSAPRLRMHVQNFIQLSDTSHDVVSATSTPAVLQSLPSSDAIAAAGRSGDVSAIQSQTLGLELNMTSLPPGATMGGRIHIEVSVDYYLLQQTLGGGAGFMWLNVPQGIDVASTRFPLRLQIDQRDFALRPPHQDPKLSMLTIFFLVLLGVAVVASLWKYYNYRREQEFNKFVQRAKEKSAREAAAAKQDKLQRKEAAAARSREAANAQASARS